MSDETLTEAEFLRDVRNHQLEVLREDGLYRHLRFSQPDTINRRFDLVTWPGHLVYTGDMGDYHFSRIRDMLVFFRGDHINPSYWGQKLLSVGRHGGFREWRETRLKEALRDAFDCEYPDGDERIWSEVREEIIGRADGESEETARRLVDEFTASDGWEITDFWEYDLQGFTHGFLWCCYALVWGIRMYDRATGEAPA
ncbi:MAG: hypothetical protein AAFU79_02050 [Myxococcota bacterium]